MSGLLRELLRRTMDENNVPDEDEEPMDDDSEEEPFDIALPASHSYMGGTLASLSGRALLEGGWRGRVPLLVHSGALFPGETVPLLLTHPHDARAIRKVLAKDKFFGLLASDETGARVSLYGTLCEVFEADADIAEDAPLSLKGRAIHRFKLMRPKSAGPCKPLSYYSRVREELVSVLPEPQRADPLFALRMRSLDQLRHRNNHRHPTQRMVRSMDAAGTPWPTWVYDMFNYDRMRGELADYYRTINLEDKMPSDPVSLSFWASSNLALSSSERLALLRAGDALQRLALCCKAAQRARRGGTELCCTHCRAAVAQDHDVFAMSSEGVHSNYTNLGGYLHDVVTVSNCNNVSLSGEASDEYSWFPGYSWTIALCGGCSSHVGWRFKAMRRNLRPQQFFGLSRSYVEPVDPDRDMAVGGV